MLDFSSDGSGSEHAVASEHDEPAARDAATPPDLQSPRRTFRPSTPMALGVSIATIACAIAAASVNVGTALPAILAIAGVVLLLATSALAAYRTLAGAFVLVRAVRGRTSADVHQTVVDLVGNLAMTGLGALVAYLGTVGFSRGRQLRRFGKVLLPDLQSNPDWTAPPIQLDGRDEPPVGLAQQWRENGKTEHASVAAFARLTLDLMALGAPPALVAAANQDALDEIRHAELCFSLAKALDGRAVSPAAFPQAQRVSTLPRSRRLALAKLAVDSLVDGALHEGVSARIIAKLAHRCEIPAIREVLKEIAADEGRHAAHGWAVVGWCLDAGGAPVGQALVGAVRALPRRMHSDLPEGASQGEWERWGIHGRQLEDDEYQKAVRHVTDRVHVLVLDPATRAA